VGIRRKEDKFKNDARNGGMEGGCLPDQAALVGKTKRSTRPVALELRLGTGYL